MVLPTFARQIQCMNTAAMGLLNQGDYLGAHVLLSHAIEVLEAKEEQEITSQKQQEESHHHIVLHLVAQDHNLAPIPHVVGVATTPPPQHHGRAAAGVSLAHLTLFHKSFNILYDHHQHHPTRSHHQRASSPSSGDHHPHSEEFLLLWLSVLLYNRGLCQHLAALFVGPAQRDGTYFKIHMQKALLAYETSLNVLGELLLLQHEEDDDDEDHGEGVDRQEQEIILLELALLNNCNYIYSCGVTGRDCRVQAELFRQRIMDCVQIVQQEETKTPDRDHKHHARQERTRKTKGSDVCSDDGMIVVVMNTPTRNFFCANTKVCLDLLRQQHNPGPAAA